MRADDLPIHPDRQPCSGIRNRGGSAAVFTRKLLTVALVCILAAVGSAAAQRGCTLHGNTAELAGDHLCLVEAMPPLVLQVPEPGGVFEPVKSEVAVRFTTADPSRRVVYVALRNLPAQTVLEVSARTHDGRGRSVRFEGPVTESLFAPLIEDLLLEPGTVGEAVLEFAFVASFGASPLESAALPSGARPVIRLLIGR